jgi:ABC-type multidrug transport system permease subunit
MVKKANDTEELLEEVILRLNSNLQNQLSIESQREIIKEFEEQLGEIKEAIKKQTEILNTLKSYIVPFNIIMFILVSSIIYYLRTRL